MHSMFMEDKDRKYQFPIPLKCFINGTFSKQIANIHETARFRNNANIRIQCFRGRREKLFRKFGKIYILTVFHYIETNRAKSFPRRVIRSGYVYTRHVPKGKVSSFLAPEGNLFSRSS